MQFWRVTHSRAVAQSRLSSSIPWDVSWAPQFITPPIPIYGLFPSLSSGKATPSTQTFRAFSPHPSTHNTSPTLLVGATFLLAFPPPVQPSWAPYSLSMLHHLFLRGKPDHIRSSLSVATGAGIFLQSLCLTKGSPQPPLWEDHKPQALIPL